MNNIEKAADIIKKGGIVIFPTDTAYGIGCRVDDQKAVERLFKIRKRPQSQATPVLFSDKAQALSYFQKIESPMGLLMDKYWPGALTIVYSCQTEKVPSLVRGGGRTLGARVPNNNIIKEIIKKVRVPVLGPSANFHGEQTPFSISQLDPQLIKLVDYVIEGEVKLKKPSTVIDCTVYPWKILRQGAVDINL